jgi:hypothetical protein
VHWLPAGPEQEEVRSPPTWQVDSLLRVGRDHAHPEAPTCDVGRLTCGHNACVGCSHCLLVAALSPSGPPTCVNVVLDDRWWPSRLHLCHQGLRQGGGRAAILGPVNTRGPGWSAACCAPEQSCTRSHSSWLGKDEVGAVNFCSHKAASLRRFGLVWTQAMQLWYSLCRLKLV